MIDDEPTSSDHVASVSPVRDQAVPNQECHPSAFYGCANVCGYAASDGPECSGVSGIQPTQAGPCHPTGD